MVGKSPHSASRIFWRSCLRRPAFDGQEPRPIRRDGGFTLLEILVAFIIAAIALGALFGGAAEGLRASRAALAYEEAIARARSHLAASEVAPMPGDEQGDDGSGFRWRVRIRPVESFRKRAEAPRPLAQPAQRLSQPVAGGPFLGTGITLYAITVWISWREAGQAREVRLDSESLKAEPPSSPSVGNAASPGQPIRPPGG